MSDDHDPIAPISDAPGSPAVIEELRQASAERKADIQQRLGQAAAAEPPRPRRGATAAPAAGRERNGIFDAPDPRTQAIRNAATATRQRLAEIARVIQTAEQICPRHLALLQEDGAAEIALRTEEFDVEAAARFLADATALLDGYKPKSA